MISRCASFFLVPMLQLGNQRTFTKRTFLIEFYFPTPNPLAIEITPAKNTNARPMRLKINSGILPVKEIPSIEPKIIPGADWMVQVITSGFSNPLNQNKVRVKILNIKKINTTFALKTVFFIP